MSQRDVVIPAVEEVLRIGRSRHSVARQCDRCRGDLAERIGDDDPKRYARPAWNRAAAACVVVAPRQTHVSRVGDAVLDRPLEPERRNLLMNARSNAELVRAPVPVVTAEVDVETV